MYNILVTPNTLYSFLLHPISNKIPSPKELVYPDELFYFSFIHAGSRDSYKFLFISKIERYSVLEPKSEPNRVKKRVGV